MGNAANNIIDPDSLERFDSVTNSIQLLDIIYMNEFVMIIHINCVFIVFQPEFCLTWWMKVLQRLFTGGVPFCCTSVESSVKSIFPRRFPLGWQKTLEYSIWWPNIQRDTSWNEFSWMWISWYASCGIESLIKILWSLRLPGSSYIYYREKHQYTPKVVGYLQNTLKLSKIICTLYTI